MDGLFYAKAAAFLGAAIAMGIGSLGPALGQGLIGAKACENLSKAPNDEVGGKIRLTMMMAMGLVFLFYRHHAAGCYSSKKRIEIFSI